MGSVEIKMNVISHGILTRRCSPRPVQLLATGCAGVDCTRRVHP